MNDDTEEGNLDGHSYIEIFLDKGTDKLIITGKGIGMTDVDINTIVKNCDKDFMVDLANGAAVSMIGQFGFGFYMAYLVAERVVAGSIWDVGDDDKYVWECLAAGYYTVTKNILGRIRMTLFFQKDNRKPIKKQSVFVSLKDYFKRMKQGLVLANRTWSVWELKAAKPFFDELKKKGYEIHSNKFGESTTNSAIMNGLIGLKLDESEAEKKKVAPKKFENLCAGIKKFLSDKVEDVVVSDRVMDSPCRLVMGGAGGYGWTANMEMIIKVNESRFGSSMEGIMLRLKMEINPNNSIIEELRKRSDVGFESNLEEKLVLLLYVTALVTSCFFLYKYDSVLCLNFCYVMKEMLMERSNAIVDAAERSNPEDRIPESTKRDFLEKPVRALYEELQEDKRLPDDIKELLSATFSLSVGFTLDDPDTFANIVHLFVKQALKLKDDEVSAGTEMPAVLPVQLFYSSLC